MTSIFIKTAPSSSSSSPPTSSPPSPEEQFWEACSEGNLPLAQSLLSSHPKLDLNRPDEVLARTPLYRACFCGHQPIVSFLLSLQQVDVNYPRDNGATPLLAASENGHGEIVSMLLEDSRTEPNIPERQGGTPLYVACENGRAGVVRRLLGDPRVQVNRPSGDYTTPLWIAAQENQIEVIKELFASGRKIDVKMVSCWNHANAQQMAEAAGNMEVVDLIQRYEDDPQRLIAQLRIELGLNEEIAAQYYVLIRFYSEKLLELREREVRLGVGE